MNIGNIYGNPQIIETNNGNAVQRNNSSGMNDQQMLRILEVFEAFYASNASKDELTGKQRKKLSEDIKAAKAAKSEERRKIILTILQGLAHIASIGASTAKILGG